MKAPKNLRHKPIVSVNDYEEIDAQSTNNTDVKALSIGKAQYNSNHISLKVWRHTGKKWSRQSEEIPLHRVIDLNILLLGSLMANANSEYPKTILREEILDKKDLQLIKDYYLANEHYLKPRLEELKSRIIEFLK